MINSVLVALASEAFFLIGIFIGGVIAALAAFAVTAIRGIGHLSSTRALLQGLTVGIVAGAAGLLVAVLLGRDLSIPGGRLLWLALIPPMLGEFGYFLNRLSLRHRAKPDTGVFVPLGRLHGAAWTPFRFNIYNLCLVDLRAYDPEDIPRLAAQNTAWFIGRVMLGFVAGVITAMWALAISLHVSPFL